MKISTAIMLLEGLRKNYGDVEIFVASEGMKPSEAEEQTKRYFTYSPGMCSVARHFGSNGQKNPRNGQ